MDSNMTNGSNASDQCHRYSNTVTIILGIVLYIIAIVTIGGNILVVTSFIRFKELRSFGNYFILNLSISDLIIGLLMAVYIPYVITGCWHLTHAGCITFNVLDYAVPLASTWNIALISLDRYLSVARPIQYRLKQRPRLAMQLMLIPWIIGFLFYGPSVITWEYWVGERVVPEHECFVEFYNNVPYLISNSVIEFIVPFVIVASINLLIYLNIRKRSKSLLSGSSTRRYSNNSPTHNNNQKTEEAVENSPANHKVVPSSSGSSGAKLAYQTSHDRRSSGQDAKRKANKKRFSRKFSISASTGQHLDSKSKAALSRDRKTARSLAVLVGVFLLTWAPYEICALVNPICSFCIPGYVFDIVFWLLWINSTINPFLYALLQLKFRRAFITILNCWTGKNMSTIIPLAAMHNCPQ